jgi:hypothetical protein
MKRTAIRRRRAKPRPLDDTRLYEEYREKCLGVCEVAYYTGIIIKFGRPMMLAERVEWPYRLQRHHLFSLGRRPDRWSNLIVLTEEMHRWVQQVEPQKGRVLCLLAKARKAEQTGNPAECDVSELNECAGRNVIGIVEGYRFEEERWKTWQSECVSRLAKLARESGNELDAGS